MSGAVSCCCLSWRCCSRSVRAASNRAAHRCSHLLSRSRGILLITKAPGFGLAPGLRPQRMRASKGPPSTRTHQRLSQARRSAFGQFDYGRIVHWKVDRPKRILGTCPNRVIDPVDAARFITAASTLQRLARLVALNAQCAARLSRVGTPLGCLDIGSSPVQLRRYALLMATNNASYQFANS